MYQPIEQFVCHVFWIYVLKKSVVFFNSFLFCGLFEIEPETTQKWILSSYHEYLGHENNKNTAIWSIITI